MIENTPIALLSYAVALLLAWNSFRTFGMFLVVMTPSGDRADQVLTGGERRKVLIFTSTFTVAFAWMAALTWGSDNLTFLWPDLVIGIGGYYLNNFVITFHRRIGAFGSGLDVK